MCAFGDALQCDTPIDTQQSQPISNMNKLNSYFTRENIMQTKIRFQIIFATRGFNTSTENTLRLFLI